MFFVIKYSKFKVHLNDKFHISGKDNTFFTKLKFSYLWLDLAETIITNKILKRNTFGNTESQLIS
jgi:hypothetical protein